MIVLYDDAAARGLEPFATSRPFCEVRSGALLGRERWTAALGDAACVFVSGPHLAAYGDAGVHVCADDEIPAGTWVINSRAIPLTDTTVGHGISRLMLEGRVAALRLGVAIPRAMLDDGTCSLEHMPSADGATCEVGGVWITAPWDLIRHLTDVLASDIRQLGTRLPTMAVAHVAAGGPCVLGSHPVWCEAGAVIEPFTVLDATAGPILVRRGARVEAFTRVIGPCYVGVDATILGGRIAASAIGDGCRVHGDVSVSILHGQSNKAHDGFLGHSVVGQWVNLGAGTTTSNLKSTYGTITSATPAGPQDTGLQFLGSLIGDYVKTGIGLHLSPGTSVGSGSILTGAMPPTVVPAFSWGAGAPYGRVQAQKFVETTARMMARRGVTMSAGAQRCLEAIHAHAVDALEQRPHHQPTAR